MIEHRHLACGFVPAFVRAGRTPAFALLLCILLAGCHHKIPLYTIPLGPQIELEQPPTDEPSPTIATVPLPDLGPPLESTPLPAAPKRRPTPAPKEETPPAQAATEAAPAELAIGTLSTGVDVTPQIQQQTQELIASIYKRIASLPAHIAGSQKRQVEHVRNFLKQAQQALNSGDAEGANNLATKARLLMDDLEKK